MEQVTEDTDERGPSPNEDPDSYFYLTHIAVERGEEPISTEPSFDIADLWVRDVEDPDGGRCYPLVSVTPSRWEVKGAIKLPKRIRGIQCEVRCPSGHARSIVHVDCTAVGSRTVGLQGASGQIVEVDREGESRAISWEFNISRSPEDEDLAAHMNACSSGDCKGLAYTERAIETLQAALRLTPISHPTISVCFMNIAEEYKRAFNLAPDLSHLDDAISTLDEALGLTPKNHPRRISYLRCLAGILMRRFYFTQDASNLDRAISERRKVVKAAQKEGLPASPRWSDRLELAHSLLERFRHRGDLSDLSDSIAFHVEALKLRLKHHASLRFLSKELACSFPSFIQAVDDFLHDGKTHPPKCNTQEAGVPSYGHDLPYILSNLASSFELQFQCVGKLSDLAAVVSLQRLSVHLASESHPAFSHFVDSLGSSLRLRFKRMGELCDIYEAISVYRRSANAENRLGCHSGKHEDGQSCTVHSIASCFRDKFEVTQDRSDLDEAIHILQGIVTTDPNEIAHPCAAAWLRSLASAFGARFEHTRDRRDITEAISMQDTLVQRSHHQDDIRIVSQDLIRLSDMLESRFDESGDMDDIDRAISLGRTAIDLIPDNCEDLPIALCSLAASLTSRAHNKATHSESGCLPTPLPEDAPRKAETPALASGLVLDYLVEAVDLVRKAIDLTPERDPDLAHRLDGLAAGLHARFHHSRDLCDIEEALRVQEKAVKLVPDWHDRKKSTYRAHLAAFFHCWYGHAGSADDLARTSMVSNYEAALTSPFRSPKERFESAIQLARHSVEATKVIAAFDAAIDMVALMVGLEQTVAQRYSHIRSLSEIPIEAAAVACSFGRPDKAVEWLEQGRCLIWSQLNSLRTPLDTLREHDPDLATEIADISRKLEAAGSTRRITKYRMPDNKKRSLDNEARAHARLARRWEELLVKARAITGFESFLKPIPCSALVEQLPSSGNIVIITAHEMRCDAIALVAGLGEPLHIPLPDLTVLKAMAYSDILDKSLGASRSRSQGVHHEEYDEGEGTIVDRSIRRYRVKDRNIVDVLKAIWTEAVKPILDALAIPKADDPSGSIPPRIWWCATGVLSFLPLHAAGVYSDAVSECVLDYVASSYTPSISSLLERVRDDRKADEEVSGLFLTNQPNVHGYSRIYGTTKEVNSVHQLAAERGVRVRKAEGSELSVAGCLRYMEEYSSVHFACHGIQNAAKPLKSKLSLESGAVELGAIMQKNLKGADLAFLSACETSAGEETLNNEAVHLAAGMLAAGYRRVVGTMWEISDIHAVDVAHDFYSYLFDHMEEGSGPRFDGSLSAHALHRATWQLRERLDAARKKRGAPDDLEESLLVWVPYVHFGY